MVSMTIPEVDEEAEEDFYAEEGRLLDSMSTDAGVDDEWLKLSISFLS